MLAVGHKNEAGHKVSIMVLCASLLFFSQLVTNWNVQTKVSLHSTQVTQEIHRSMHLQGGGLPQRRP